MMVNIKKQFKELNDMLKPLVGEELCMDWWLGSNKAFNGTRPLSYLCMGGYLEIREYLLRQYNGVY